MAATLDPDHYNPLDPATMQCPYPHYERLRRDDPVHYVEEIDAWVVTRHELVAQVVRDPATFSSRRGRALVQLTKEQMASLRAVQDAGYPRMATLLTADPPAHTRFRRLVSKAFSPPAIAALAPMIRDVTSGLIDAWSGTQSIEFVESFAVPLPVVVIAKALNVPDHRLADFKRWSDDTVVGFGNAPTIDDLLRAEHGVNELQAYFADEIERRRTHPEGDILTALLEARVDDADGEVTDRRPLETAEILSLIQQLLVGGNETTTKMLADMMWRLAEQPDLWNRVRRDPSSIPGVIEETVRLASPVQAIWRVTTREVELGGTTIPENRRVVIAFGSANRDERVFSDPDEFVLDRPSIGEHIGFGRGVHFCIGAALARLEGKIALEELSRRIGAVRLAEGNRLEYNESFMLRGLTGLGLEIDMAPVEIGA